MRNKAIFPIFIFVFGMLATLMVQSASSWWQTRGLSEDQKALHSLSRILRIAPEDKPNVTTVSDVSKLRGQQFFRYAENGDKVFIFNTSQKAVLYRPSTGAIIDVAPIQLLK